jgi:acid ceramidase
LNALQNAFTLTVNERFTLKGGFYGIIKWLLGSQNLKWLGFLTREVMENATSFKTAQKMIMKAPLLAPAYYILGGLKANEGCVITRGQKKVEVWTIGESSLSQNSSWYLVQTNYDNWKKPPFWDDRRTPAIQCMNEVNSTDVNFATLYDVLSTRPVLNKVLALL